MGDASGAGPGGAPIIGVVPDAPPSPTRLALPQGLLLFVGFAALLSVVYGSALRAPFYSDDFLFYVDNSYVAAPTLDNVVEILDPRGGAKYSTANYAPVSLLLSLVQIQAFGDATFGYHLTNLLLHALNAVLLIALLRASGISGSAALLGGALFAFHPANVEAVAWASQLRTLAAVALGLGALLTLWRHPAWATALFVLAVLTKFQAAAFLPMAMAFAWARRVPFGWRGVWPWLGGWAVMLGGIAVPQVAAFRAVGALDEPAFADVGVWVRSMAAYGAHYLQMAATGLGVSAFQEPEPAFSWLDRRWIAGLVLGGLLAARLVATLRQRREEAAWWVSSAAAFVMVAQLGAFRYATADRYLYLILPGLIGGSLLLAQDVAARWLRRGGSARLLRTASRAALAAAAVLICLAALQTSRRAALWEEPFRLHLDAAAHYPSGSQAHFVRAVRAAHSGDVERAVAELRAAEEKKRMSLAMSFGVNPYLAPIHYEPAFQEFVRETARSYIERVERRGLRFGERFTVASAYDTLGDYDKAIALLEAALREGDPDRERLLGLLERVRARRAEELRREVGRPPGTPPVD